MSPSKCIAAIVLCLALVIPALASGLALVEGTSIGRLDVNMTAVQISDAMGKPDFARNNEDGTSLAEWGLLNNAEIPDARLWVLFNPDLTINRIGTDSPIYVTEKGDHVGVTIDRFIADYGPATSQMNPDCALWPDIGLGACGNPDSQTISELFVFKPVAP